MKNKLKWIAIGLIIAAGGFVFYNSRNQGVEAETFTVSRGEMQQYLEDTAEVLSREKQTVYIEGSGKVIDVKADVGDSVKQGDLLLSLEKSDLELQLRDAEARIEASKAQLKGTELINYANKIELAKVTVTQAQNAYEAAQRNLQTAKNLYESKALSKDELDKAQDAYNSASTTLDSANVQLADVKQGAPEYLKNSYKAQLEQAVIYRDTILKSLRNQEVRAAADGVIIEKHIEKNSPAAPSTIAFVIGDVKKLELEADILADDVNKVSIGNEVQISGKPIGDSALRGKVIKIAPAAKIVVSSLGVNQKRVTVTIEILDQTGMLKPGYNVDVRIITAVKNNVIKVPDTSVFEYKGKSSVMAVNNEIAQVREVKRGIESGNFIEIEEGLKEGDIILTKPDNKIEEGVRIKPSEKQK